MIKIESNNIDKIANDYFEKIKSNCLARADLLAKALSVLFNGANIKQVIDDPIHYNTKYALLNTFLDNEVKNAKDYHLLNAGNLKHGIAANRTQLINIANHLKVESNLKKIILCKPKDCYTLNIQLTNRYGTHKNKKLFATFINRILYYNLCYPLSYELCYSLGVNTCPYCNRIYINTVVDDDENVIRPTLDHFFSQAEHPFLALSFFNLIPSCYYCNSNLKNASEIKLKAFVHPYIEGFDKACVFKVDLIGNKPDKSDPSNYKIALLRNIAINDPKSRKIFGRPNNKREGNVNLFKLESIYQSHLDVVGEIIFKCDKYKKGYPNSLFTFFNLLKTNKDEFYQFYFGNYLNDQDFNRRPLAKLMRDIVVKELPRFL